MDGHQAGPAALARQAPQVLEHGHLVVQVEVRHRLVEQQQRRILRQQRRQPHALAFAAGQRGDVVVGQRAQVHRVQRGMRDAAVVRALPGPAAQVRMAAEQHHVGDAGAEGIVLRLRQQAALARQLAHRPVGQRLALEHDASGTRRAQPGQRVQQRGLAAAVGPQHAPQFAAMHLQVEGVDQRARSGHHLQAFHVEQRLGHRRPPRPSSRAMKVGTPSSAVITPTGSCCGATSVRAIVSVTSSSVPPASAQAGSSTR